MIRIVSAITTEPKMLKSLAFREALMNAMCEGNDDSFDLDNESSLMTQFKLAQAKDLHSFDLEENEVYAVLNGGDDEDEAASIEKKSHLILRYEENGGGVRFIVMDEASVSLLEIPLTYGEIENASHEKPNPFFVALHMDKPFILNLLDRKGLYIEGEERILKRLSNWIFAAIAISLFEDKKISMNFLPDIAPTRN